MAALTAEELRRVLSYDPKTGIFRWRVKTAQRIHIGDVAGSVHHTGHRYIAIRGRDYGAHRLAWLYVHGEWAPEEIDHINGNGDDNRIANLREATHAQNLRNARKRRDNTSGFKGAKWHKRVKMWNAAIGVNGKIISLGYFNTKEAAHAAYCVASAKYHGEFGRTK